jgi:hypothetical protein
MVRFKKKDRESAKWRQKRWKSILVVPMLLELVEEK